MAEWLPDATECAASPTRPRARPAADILAKARRVGRCNFARRGEHDRVLGRGGDLGHTTAELLRARSGSSGGEVDVAAGGRHDDRSGRTLTWLDSTVAALEGTEVRILEIVRHRPAVTRTRLHLQTDCGHARDETAGRGGRMESELALRYPEQTGERS